ncbi:NADH-dependent flavin oxidoreductase [Streptococcus catagoni]|uniref:NADH-dependent flavin oxidoreductase n=1 Tax=Streptococcus catagoni TaxID=2654874 RepID=UPI00140981F1|nr:NADH-dependent flavin oxidoreductase [Streptococcus catagoni]
MTVKIQNSFTFTNGLTMPNRVVLAPITLAVSKAGGYVSEEDIAFYKRRSAAVGMAITGSAYIDPSGQAFPNSFSVAEDDKIQGLKQVAQAIQSQGALAILQIYHGGRMVPPQMTETDPIAPSSIRALRGTVSQPRALEYKEIEEVLALFIKAIERAIEAGFDGVELHGANTYLIQQFFSPHSNRRKDKWGGTLNNRMRFAKSLVKKAKQLLKEKSDRPFLIGYRLSPEEIEEPGITLSDTLQLVEQLIHLQIDYLHLSMDNVWQSSLRDKSQKEPLIWALKKKIKGRVPLIAVGKIKSVADAQKVLDEGIPLFALGQSLLLEPDWTQKVLAGQEDQIIRAYRDDLHDQVGLPDAFIDEFRDFLEGKY